MNQNNLTLLETANQEVVDLQLKLSHIMEETQQLKLDYEGRIADFMAADEEKRKLSLERRGKMTEGEQKLERLVNKLFFLFCYFFGSCVRVTCGNAFILTSVNDYFSLLFMVIYQNE